MNAKKKLKEEYKHKKNRMGVFQIRNTANGKIYVGSSLNLDAIWNRNKMELNFLKLFKKMKTELITIKKLKHLKECLSRS